jgi:protein-S-isoprenylcysteine O-methyltransferase Ste14
MLATGVAVFVGISTLLFLAVGCRKRSGDQHVTRHEPWSRLGTACQAIAFAAVFTIRSRSGLFGGWGSLRDALPWISLLLGGLAWTLLVTAQRALGRQWSVGARLIEGHQLVISGPYALVRHPIYLGLLLLLIAAGLAETTPIVLAGAVVLFLMGFSVRSRAEERLLRGAFGDEWERYRRRVPAIVPRPGLTSARR